jgi:hypothetical protein
MLRSVRRVHPVHEVRESLRGAGVALPVGPVQGVLAPAVLVGLMPLPQPDQQVRLIRSCSQLTHE